jgi:hypothetical protein
VSCVAGPFLARENRENLASRARWKTSNQSESKRGAAAPARTPDVAALTHAVRNPGRDGKRYNETKSDAAPQPHARIGGNSRRSHTHPARKPRNPRTHLRDVLHSHSGRESPTEMENATAKRFDALLRWPRTYMRKLGAYTPVGKSSYDHRTNDKFLSSPRAPPRCTRRCRPYGTNRVLSYRSTTQ